ncbi:MAG: sirohydrochlorin chelatase [Hormoscilla sp. SP5CHS1]|nr:sirohydrochlorin chelatase [Hormoscilla sp. SP12CHS1]MBC6452669.1 sirohydrochlorin chelatase [Hormoscilla sp. SP5CHS1]MBC6476306.1 sirohydrochlorin chelatase [Hormoscilla sp. GM102CHS1]
MKVRSAYILVSHGSRDRRPQLAMAKLGQLLSDKLGVEVGTATLELGPLPLHAQICELANRAIAVGCKQLQVLPLFMLPGVHVMEDIPAAVALAQQALGNRMAIEIRPYLGSHGGLEQLLATQQQELLADAWILLSHGSRSVGGNQPVLEMASKLSAMAAYWSVRPTLESSIAELAADGAASIGILPYFLFAGGITEAIAWRVRQLLFEFPTVQLQLGKPIEASVELADLILELI